MARDTRPISWLKAARKDFENFPEGARLEILRALSKTGIKTPKEEIDLIRTRLKRLKEALS